MNPEEIFLVFFSDSKLFRESWTITGQSRERRCHADEYSNVGRERLVKIYFDSAISTVVVAKYQEVRAGACARVMG